MNTKHFNALDGLRGVAALAVAWLHACVWLAPDLARPNIGLAVDFFFVLSGFVVCHAYEIRLWSGMSVRHFTLLRIIRLYPLVLIGAGLGLSYVVAHAFAQHDRQAAMAALLQAPFALLGIPLPPALADKPFAINEPSWSLFFEMILNILFALALPLLKRSGLAAITVASTILLIMASILYGTSEFGFTYDTLALGLVRAAAPFFIGVWLCRSLREGRLGRVGALPAMPFALSALLLLAVLLAPDMGRHMVAYRLGSTILIFPFLILASLKTSSGPFWGAVERTAGRLSYPLYITHFPLLSWFAVLAKAAHQESRSLVAAFLILAVAAAWLLDRLYDRPVRGALTRLIVDKR